MCKFVIPLRPITKKNHLQIVTNRKTGRPMVIQSKQYRQYEKDCKFFMPKVEMIDYPVNIKAVFYMPTRHKVDLVNLQQALLDILVTYGILADDNSRIVYSMDGSYVSYDKDNPRTEVRIKKREDI